MFVWLGFKKWFFSVSFPNPRCPFPFFVSIWSLLGPKRRGTKFRENSEKFHRFIWFIFEAICSFKALAQEKFDISEYLLLWCSFGKAVSLSLSTLVRVLIYCNTLQSLALPLEIDMITTLGKIHYFSIMYKSKYRNILTQTLDTFFRCAGN